MRALDSSSIVNGLSVDLEEWFQVANAGGAIDRSDWEQLSDRIEPNCDRLLAMFEETAVKATFFVPGAVARRWPQLLGRIVRHGHEIANHGWDHVRVSRLDRAQFRHDLIRSKAALEDAAGVAVSGYRAASFSLERHMPWAYSELAEQGYAYSSSVNPARGDPRGWGDAPRFAFKPLPWSDLVELPLTTAEFAGRRVMVGGGTFRHKPYSVARWAIRQVNQRNRRPAIFFIHPWEVDPLQQPVTGAHLKLRSQGREASMDMPMRLERVLREFAWGRLDVLASREAPLAVELAA